MCTMSSEPWELCETSDSESSSDVGAGAVGADGVGSDVVLSPWKHVRTHAVALSNDDSMTSLVVMYTDASDTALSRNDSITASLQSLAHALRAANSVAFMVRMGVITAAAMSVACVVSWATTPEHTVTTAIATDSNSRSDDDDDDARIESRRAMV
jgi:hypothetical protein